MKDLKFLPLPDILIIHLNSNDLVSRKFAELYHSIRETPLYLRLRLPKCILLWSDILPRLSWRGARRPKAIDRARKRVSSDARVAVKNANGEFIEHPDLTESRKLFENYGVHLSPKGNDIFIRGFAVALNSVVNKTSQVSL